MSLPDPLASQAATASGTFFARVLSGVDDPFLEMTATSGNVFQSRTFLQEFERHMLAGSRQLVLVGVTDAAGNPVAAFPFVRLRRFGVATLEAVDFGIVDYFAPSCFRDAALSVEDTNKVWTAVVKAAPGVHAVTFKKLPRLMHGRPHALSGADFLKPMGADATTLYLRDAKGRPTGSMDPASIERKLKKAGKVLQKFGPLTFDEALTKEDAEAYLKVLVCFRTARFEELGRHDALVDPNVVAFYRTLADRSRKEAPGRLFALRSGGEIVAVTYGFAYQDSFTLIAPAITPKTQYQSGSPGLVAMFKTLSWCQEQGLRVFDLSVGSLSYKSRFDAEPVELFEYQRALSPLGLVVVAEAGLRRRIRHLSLKHPDLRTALEKLRRARWRRPGEKHANA